jgi:SsrA-binding protein
MDILFRNKKALARFEVLDKLEAGIILKGYEVKAIREGKVNLIGSFITFIHNKPVVTGLYIGRYSKYGRDDYDPERTRALLLTKKEIDFIAGRLDQKGYTAVPLSVYISKNRVKLELGIVKGKKLHDRREELKKREFIRTKEIELRGKM